MQLPVGQQLEPLVDVALGAFESQTGSQFLADRIVALLKPGLCSVLPGEVKIVFAQKVALVSCPRFV